jgi:hypothetical protein
MPHPLVSAMMFLTHLTCSFGEGGFGLGLPICRIGGGELGNFLYFVWTKGEYIPSWLREVLYSQISIF